MRILIRSVVVAIRPYVPKCCAAFCIIFAALLHSDTGFAKDSKESSNASNKELQRLSKYCGYFGSESANFLKQETPWKSERAPSNAEFKKFSSRLMEAFTLVQRYSGSLDIKIDDIRLVDVPNTASVKSEPKDKQRALPERLILINNNFVESIFAYALSDRLNRNTKTGELLSGQRYDWPLITVLAHHYAYHLFETSAGNECDPQIVLKADWYSGHLLQEMQSPLSQVSYLIHQFAPVCGTETHPAREERILALVGGFREACEKDDTCSITNELESLRHLTSQRPVQDCSAQSTEKTLANSFDLVCKANNEELLIDLPKSMSGHEQSVKPNASMLGTVYRRKTIVPSDRPDVVGQFIRLPAQRAQVTPGSQVQSGETQISQCDGLVVLEQTTLFDVERQAGREIAACGPTSSMPTSVACFQSTKTGGQLLDFSGQANKHACRRDENPILGNCHAYNREVKPPKFETLCLVGGQQYLVDNENQVYDRRLLEPGVSPKFIGKLTGANSSGSRSNCQQTLEIPRESVCIRTENPFAKNALRCDVSSIYRMRSLCLNRDASGRTVVSPRRDSTVSIGTCMSCEDNSLCPGHRS